jgi:hypothetical protein
MAVIPITQESEVGGSCFEASMGKSMKPPSKKQTENKMVGGMAQVVEHLPSKWEALGSMLSLRGKKRKRKERDRQIDTERERDREREREREREERWKERRKEGRKERKEKE